MSRPKTNPDTIEKTCPVCHAKFTISFYLRNRRTYCSKSCSNHDPAVIAKMVVSQTKTFDEKYGMHPMKTEATIENLKAAIKEKHGVEWASQIPGWYETVKKNNVKKHGVEHYNNIEQMKRTCIERYGVDNPTKYQEIRDNINHTVKTNHYLHLVKYCTQEKISPAFTIEEYKGYKYGNAYRFRCNVCDYLFETSIYNSMGSIFCEKCNPNKRQTLENDFFNFLTSFSPTPLIIRRDRTILYGKELDFYLPEKKIAIELDGLYWHSENGHGLPKNYHLNKMKGCLAHGIRLIHIFENEWRDKPELIKSVIQTILKLNTNNSIQARKCIIKEVDVKEKNTFLNDNHLQQEDKSTIKLGLYHNGMLVSLMTFRNKSRFDRQVQWELSRFCNLKNHIISGGASKLFTYFTKTYSPTSIVSYSDRRYFSGDLYHILGFTCMGTTAPSYHYITPDYKCLYNRMNFQKHLLSRKLPVFDASLSEWKNMKNNGFDRIWDCGNSKWIWRSAIG